MKRSAFILCVTLFLAWSPVQAMVDWCAPTILLGSIAGLTYDLRRAYNAYKEYRQKCTLKRLNKKATTEQESPETTKQRRTKPRSASSFYKKQLMRGKQNVAIISALTGISSLLYLLTQRISTNASSNASSSASNQPNTQHIPQPESMVFTSPNIQGPIPYDALEITVLQQKLRSEHYRQNCGTHTAFNVLLFARGATQAEFNDQALFNQFRARAVQVIRKTDKNGMNRADILNILHDPEIRQIAGYTDTSAPFFVVADGVWSDNSITYPSKEDLNNLMRMHNAFSVAYQHIVGRSVHFLTFYFEKKDGSWIVHRAESALRASVKEATFKAVVEAILDPDLKLLNNPRHTLSSEDDSGD